MFISDHRPDEEGIKTETQCAASGLRPISDHRPDEEGIKTPGVAPGPCASEFQTTDLMKKGLRQIRETPLDLRPLFRPQT